MKAAVSIHVRFYGEKVNEDDEECPENECYSCGSVDLDTLIRVDIKGDHFFICEACTCKIFHEEIKRMMH